MRKLYVCTSDDLYGLYDLVSLFLKTFLAFFGNGQHWCGTERISCVDTKRVNVFNKANGNHVVVCVADNLKLKFFPAENRFFYENLTYQAGLQTSCTDGFQFFAVVDKSAPGSSHGVGRAKNNRITQFVCNSERILHAVCNFTACHFNSQGIHRLFKFNTILASFDGIYLNTDDLDIVFIKNTGFVQLCAEIQSGLTAKVWQKCVRTFFGNDLLQSFYIERFNVSDISGFRVGHNCGRIGIDQNDLVAQFAKCLAGLGTGIVKFAGLTDDNRTGTYDEYFVNIRSLWHCKNPPYHSIYPHKSWNC